MKQFQNKVAVITGAASGLGKEFAKTGAALGMKLVLADVQQDPLDACLQELRSHGADAVGLKTDVSSREAVQALADLAYQEYGSVNCLFNNAGVTSSGFIWEHTQQDWAWVMNVNLYGVVNGVSVFTPLMLEQSARDPEFEGHIINTASMAGLLTAPSQGIYNVSKHAVVALSEALYHDLEIITDKIHCSVLCPSYVKTNIADSSRNRPAELMNQTGLTLSQQVARDSVASSVDAGDVTAAQVSEVTFQAIRNDDFYIFPSKGSLARVKRRMEDILAEKNPSDWFKGSPAIMTRRQRLVEALGRDRQQGEMPA